MGPAGEAVAGGTEELAAEGVRVAVVWVVVAMVVVATVGDKGGKEAA